MGHYWGTRLSTIVPTVISASKGFPEVLGSSQDFAVSNEIPSWRSARIWRKAFGPRYVDREL
jgi:hypothetical protein